MPSQSVSSAWRAVRIVCTASSDVIERLAHAATAVHGVAHPALLAPLQIVRERGRLGVVTRDVPGVTLARLAKHATALEQALPQRIVLRIVLDLLEGLHALEASSDKTKPGGAWLYGGLTPESIHVGLDGQTRVLDPGVMAAAAREAIWAAERHRLAYTAPELHTAGARYDVRVDIFAVGVVLWELLACRSLFLEEDAHETIDAVCHAPIPRVQRARFVRGEPIAAAVANVVARVLDREPARRFASYGELAVALRGAAPAAEAEEVAAFVATREARGSERLFGDGAQPTDQLDLREPREATVDVQIDTLRPPASDGRPADESQPIAKDAVQDDQPQRMAPDLASVAAEPDVALPDTIEPELWLPPRRFAWIQGRHAAWALGATLLVVIVTLALRKGSDGGSHAASVIRAPTTSASSAIEVRAPEQESPGAAPANEPALPAPSGPMPEVNDSSPAPAPKVRKAHPTLRKTVVQARFIPQDI